MEKQLNQEEILDETIQFYGNSPQLRGMFEDACAYNAGEGKHCAIGRCLLPELKEQGRALMGNIDSVDCLMDKQGVDDIDKLLLPQYRGHSLRFWSALQGLHDAPIYWNEDGLTPCGINNSEHLRDRIRSGKFN